MINIWYLIYNLNEKIDKQEERIVEAKKINNQIKNNRLNKKDLINIKYDLNNNRINLLYTIFKQLNDLKENKYLNEDELQITEMEVKNEKEIVIQISYIKNYITIDFITNFFNEYKNYLDIDQINIASEENDNWNLRYNFIVKGKIQNMDYNVFK